MKKTHLIMAIIICLSFIVGCENKKIKLEEEYYNTNEFITTSSNEINKLMDEKKSFVLFAYNNYCSLPISCDKIFEEYMKIQNISFLSIPFKEFKNTQLYNKIKYAPSVIIIENGKIKKYLDSESDKDLDKYQDVEEFAKWFEKYVIIKGVKNE